jgi:predicted ATPase
VLTTLAVENYRSLRRLVLSPGRLTVVTGANGSGKSNLYRALRLLGECARNGAVAALAREGGLPSTLWAGPEPGGRSQRDRGHAVQGTVRSEAVSLRLGFAGDTFGYAVDLGLPMPGRTAFALDPEIKRECVWSGPTLRPSALLADRAGPAVRLRDAGRWTPVEGGLRPFDSMLSEIADPRAAPELLALREQIRSWRFYDHLRTDSAAPARSSQVGTRTPVLGHDGADLAAAVQTIREIGDAEALDDAVEHAFPGSRVEVLTQNGRFDLVLRQEGLLRPLGVAELSDGTLRFLLWTAALLSPRPPALLVVNEPETSLHPDLLPALARLVLRASRSAQTVVVTHAQPLVRALTADADDGDEVVAVRLVKDLGETSVEGQGRFEGPPWQWPRR